MFTCVGFIVDNGTSSGIRPCKPSTVTTRRRELIAAVRMAVKVGVPLTSLTSLRALIHPDVAEKVLDGYWRDDGEVPTTSAVLAQIAVAVAILTIAPIRLGNLASIRLGENLIKPGGPQSNYFLAFNKYDVKNRVPLQFKLDEVVTAIINEYVHDFRPTLMRGTNADWLFPGEGGEHKEKISFSTQIVERVEKSTGLRITVHQFRHAAGALILKHRPGEYELVRRLLGHKSVQTTIKFYLELETTQVSELFTDLVRNRVDFQSKAA